MRLQRGQSGSRYIPDARRNTAVHVFELECIRPKHHTKPSHQLYGLAKMNHLCFSYQSLTHWQKCFQDFTLYIPEKQKPARLRPPRQEPPCRARNRNPPLCSRPTRHSAAAPQRPRPPQYPSPPEPQRHQRLEGSRTDYYLVLTMSTRRFGLHECHAEQAWLTGADLPRFCRECPKLLEMC